MKRRAVEVDIPRPAASVLPPDSSRITSRENPLVRELIGLSSSSRARRQSGMALLEGAHLIACLAERQLAARVLCVSDSGLRHQEVRELFGSCPSERRIVLPDRLFDTISALAAPVGILALIAVPRTDRLPATLEDAVVLDGIQDAGNVGSLLRTAAAAGIRQVIASPGTAFLWSPKVLRAAMGAHFQLSLHEVAASEWAARTGGDVLITTGGGASTLFELDLRGPVVWVFGNEGDGVGEAARAAATRAVRVPMARGIESLNVAATAAICLFEQKRQRLAAAAAGTRS